MPYLIKKDIVNKKNEKNKIRIDFLILKKRTLDVYFSFPFKIGMESKAKNKKAKPIVFGCP